MTEGVRPGDKVGDSGGEVQVRDAGLLGDQQQWRISGTGGSQQVFNGFRQLAGVSIDDDDEEVSRIDRPAAGIESVNVVLAPGQVRDGMTDRFQI